MVTVTFANSGAVQPLAGGEVPLCSIAGGPYAAVDAYVSGGTTGAGLVLRLYATVGTLRTLVATAAYGGPPVGAASRGSLLEWVVVEQPDADFPVVAGGTQYDLVAFLPAGAISAAVQATLAGSNSLDTPQGSSGTAALPSNYGSATIATNVGRAALADVGVDQSSAVPTVALDVLASCGAGSVECLVASRNVSGADGKSDPMRQIPLPVATQYRLAVRNVDGSALSGNLTASLATYTNEGSGGSPVPSLEKDFGAVIYRPGAASSGYFVETWAEVQAAIDGHEGAIIVYVDDSLVFPAPAHVPASSGVTECYDRVELRPYRVDSLRWSVLQIDDGAQLQNLYKIRELEVTCQCKTAGKPSLTWTFNAGQGPTLVLDEQAFLAVTGDATQPGIVVAAGESLYISMHQQARMEASNALHPLVSYAGTIQLFCFGDFFLSPFALSNAGGGTWLKTFDNHGFASVLNFGAVGDGITDDSVGVQFAVTTLAGTGVVLSFPGQTFKINSTINLASNLHIVMSPDTVIDGTGLANVGHPDASNANFLAQCQSLQTTTLAAPAPAGSTTITVVNPALFTVGGWLVTTPTHLGANAGLRDKMYQVEKIVGAVITLDRALLNDYSAADVVQVIVPVENLLIDGNDATIKGVCNRAIELLGALDSRVSYLKFSGTWTDYVISWDVPSFRCVSDHLVIDGGQTALAGHAFESTEDCWAIRCQVTGAVFGYSFQDCNRGGLDDCTASNLTNQGRTGNDGIGVQLGDDGNNGLGCLEVIVRGGTFTACAFAGAYVQTASNGTLFDGCNFSHNPKYAVAIQGDVATEGTTLRKCDLTYAGDTALYIPQPVVTRTLLDACDLSHPTNQCCLVQGGPTTLRNCKGFVTGVATITGGAAGLLGAGYDFVVEGGQYDAQDTGLVFMFQSNGPIMRFKGGVRIGVQHALSTCIATETGAAATAYVDDVTVYDSSGGGGVNLVGVRAEAGHIYVGHQYDASAYPTYPIFMAAPGLASMVQDNHVHTSAVTTGTELLNQLQSRAGVIEGAVLTANATIQTIQYVPGLKYIAHNNAAVGSGHTLTITSSAGDPGVTLNPGQRAWVESDGTNMHQVTAAL